jgi:hypothetical protein
VPGRHRIWCSSHVAKGRWPPPRLILWLRHAGAAGEDIRAGALPLGGGRYPANCEACCTTHRETLELLEFNIKMGVDPIVSTGRGGMDTTGDESVEGG